MTKVYWKRVNEKLMIMLLLFLNGSQCLLLLLSKRRQWLCCFSIEWSQCTLFSWRKNKVIVMLMKANICDFYHWIETNDILLTLIDEWESLLCYFYHWIEAYVCSFHYWMETNDMLLASIDEWELKVVVLCLIFLMK
jgi:hypothetical protein